MKYKCVNCGRFIKWKSENATKEQMEEQGYPEKYDIPFCKKCGELSSYEVEKD